VSVTALAHLFDRADKAFFAEHPDRHAHIRLPYADECKGEFWSLGEHNLTRRRIILWRVPKSSPAYQSGKMPLLKIPFLAFADETIEDSDEVLLPLLRGIMQDAAREYGL
jgi:hypothetical protein